MKFPIGIVVDYLREQGYCPAVAPGAIGRSFDWVLLAQPVISDRMQEGILFVTDAPEALPPGCHAVVLGSAASAQGSALVRIENPGSVTAAALASSLQIHLLSIYQWIEDMHHALASHCTCTELLELSEPILRNYVCVSDSAFSYIAHTPNIEPIDDASRYLLEHGRYSDEVIATLAKSRLSESWTKSRPFRVYEGNAINPMPAIEHVYHLNSQYAAHLVMVCESPITPGQEFLFSQLIPAVGTVLNGMWRNESPLAQRFAPFLSSLIRNGVGDRTVAGKQADALGFPIRGVFKALVVGDTWKGGSTSFFAQRALFFLDGCWAVADGDELVILLHASERSAGRMAALEAKAFELIVGIGAHAGASRKFFDLFDLPGAVDEGRVALRYGKLRHREFMPDSPGGLGEAGGVFRFKRYFPFYACDPDAPSTMFLHREGLAESVIGAIERADAGNGAADARILRTYLRTSCSLKQTAAVLGMHRNSVSYRLKHIEQEHDLDLTDPDEVAFLTTLFALPR